MIGALTLALAVLAQPAARPGFEESHLFRALAIERLEPEIAPQGKRVVFVRVVRYEVFLEHEPFITWPNALHWLTDEDVVRQELLLAPGDLFDGEKVQESARNLRDLGIFSLVRILPVKAAAPGEIGLLVVTRDLWSLRLESEFQFTDGHVDRLLLQLTERNLAGRNKRASARFDLRPLTLRLGGLYTDRRLLGEQLYLFAKALAVLERADGSYDGFETELRVARPFYDLGQRWGFDVPMAAEAYTIRQNQAGTILTYDPDPDDADEVAIPRVWEHTFFSVEGLAQHQVGKKWVARFSAGLGFSLLDAEADVPAEHRDAFERDVLPHTFRWIYPVVGASFFANRFKVFKDLAAFAISEDVQLGPSASLTLRAPLEAFGSSAGALQLSGNVGWTEAWAGDGLVEAAAGARARFDPNDDTFYDQTLLVRVRGATPRSKAGRLVLRGDWLARRRDTQGTVTTLGGDNGLRGYPSQAFFAFGGSRLRGNVELRTAPYAISFLHVGAATFYDVGTVYTDFDDAQLYQTVGLGLRALMPQFNRVVYRFDVGVPVDGSGFVVRIGAETGQAVPVTRSEDQLYEFSVGGLSNQP